MKIGIYCRVSTDKQKDNTSIDEQKRLGIEFCSRKGFDFEIYSEQISGAVRGNQRDEFLKLETKLHTKELDGLWFYDWDRMIRDFEVGVYFRNLIADTKCKVFVLDSEKDIFSDEGSLEFGFKTLLSDYERRKIRNRMMSGRYAKWREGKGYSGQLGVGYKFLGDGEVGIDEDKAEIVRFIYKTFLYKSTKTYMSVYKRVVKEFGNGKNVSGIGNSGRIRQILMDEKYKGITTIKDKDGVEWKFDIGRIISDEDWDEVQIKVKWISSLRKGRENGNQLLKGLVDCGDCGSRMWKRRSGTTIEKGGRGKGKYDFYGCQIPQRMRYKSNGVEDIGLSCESDLKDMNRISVQKLEKVVWDLLFRVLESNKQIEESFRKKYEKDGEVKKEEVGKRGYYKRQLAKLEDEKLLMLDRLSQNILSIGDYNRYIREIYPKKKSDLEIKLRGVEKEIEKLEKVDRIEDWRSLMVKQLQLDKNTTSFSKKRRIIEDNIERIKVKKVRKGDFDYVIEILFKIEVEKGKKVSFINNENVIDCVINSSKYVSQTFNHTTPIYHFILISNFSLNFKVGYYISKITIHIL